MLHGSGCIGIVDGGRVFAWIIRFLEVVKIPSSSSGSVARPAPLPRPPKRSAGRINDHTPSARASELRTGEDNYRAAAAAIVFRSSLSLRSVVARGVTSGVVGDVDNVSVWRS